MRDSIVKGLQSGLLFAGVLIVIHLIGFSTIVISVLSATIFFALWCGIAVARRDPSLSNVVTKTVSAGLLGGVMVGLFAFLVTHAQAAGTNLRDELAALSPDAVSQISFGQGDVLAFVFNLLLFAGITIAGGIVWQIFESRGGAAAVTGQTRRLSGAVTSSGQWHWITTTSLGRVVGYGLIAILFLVLPLVIPGTLSYYTVSSVLIYVLMALGLNIVVGLAGLLDLGYVVFFAIGAYTAALLTAPAPHNLLWNYWVTIPIGVALAATIGVTLGVPVLRLRGDYLAIVTLGFGEAIQVLMKSDALTAFSNGPKGVSAIGQPMLFGQLFNSPFDFVIISAIGVAIVIFLTTRLQNSRVGRAWVAIREDETVAQAMGINTLYYKLLAFGIGASFAGLGGLLYASRNQFIGPEDNTLLVSINILSIVIVGGMGSIPGVIVGAFVLKGIPEILRDLENFRILIFAALLVLMMIWRPQGIVPSARRRLEMSHDEADADQEPESPPDAYQPSANKGVAK